MQKQRRKFLKQTAQTLGLLTAAAVGGRNALHALDGLQKRRHLVNIQCFGGWDSLWFHNGILEADIGHFLNLNGAVFDANGNWNYNGSGATRKANPYEGGSWTKRYNDRDVFQHLDGSILGPGMSMFSQQDLQEILIWRGLRSEGSHGGSNAIINQGTSGTVTAGYPARIADTLSRDFVLPLHFVEIAQTSSQLACSTGPIIGPGQPINVANSQAWTALTSPSTRDLGTPGRRELLGSAIEEANRAMASAFTLKRSKDIYAAFLSSFQAANSIGNSNYGASVEFKNLWDYYLNQMVTTINNHLFARIFSGTGSGYITNGVVTSGFIEGLGKDPGGTPGNLRECAFRWALTEFLITNNLSAVVSFDSLGGDHHKGMDSHCPRLLATFTGLKTLMDRLRGTPLPGNSGKSLLDVTTLAMTTEFDREPLMTPLFAEEPNRPGSGHWNTNSVILVGAGVAGGKAVGAFSTARRGDNLYQPLPVDPRTGQQSNSGVVLWNPAVYPTLLSIFGASTFSEVNGPGIFAPAIKSVT